MYGEIARSKKIRFYGEVAAMYVATLAFLWYAFSPFSNFKPHNPTSFLAAQTLIQPFENTPTPKKAKQLIRGKPSRIIVPRLGINLAIEDGIYNPRNLSWTLSDHNAHFATLTTQPNNVKGNTFIYGHNSQHVFGKLNQLKHNDPVIVKTSNGHAFYYRYYRARNVVPTDTQIFAYKGKPELTLQTCTGNWNELRAFHHFKLMRVVK